MQRGFKTDEDSVGLGLGLGHGRTSQPLTPHYYYVLCRSPRPKNSYVGYALPTKCRHIGVAEGPDEPQIVPP